MKASSRILTSLGVLAALGLSSPVFGGVAAGPGSELSRSFLPLVEDPDSVSFGTEILTPGKPQFRMHTDVPDLPGRSVDVPDLLDVAQVPLWNPGHLAPSKTGPHYFGDEVDLIRRAIVEIVGPSGLGGSESNPGRVHTDLPDLPDFGFPNVSADPIRKPGWGDFTDSAGPTPRLPLESATIPVPSSILLLGVAGAAASRRRRRGVRS